MYEQVSAQKKLEDQLIVFSDRHLPTVPVLVSSALVSIIATAFVILPAAHELKDPVFPYFVVFLWLPTFLITIALTVVLVVPVYAILRKWHAANVLTATALGVAVGTLFELWAGGGIAWPLQAWSIFGPFTAIGVTSALSYHLMHAYIRSSNNRWSGP